MADTPDFLTLKHNRDGAGRRELPIRRFDLGLNVFDHQLIDSEDRRCGKVDDLALEGGRIRRSSVACSRVVRDDTELV